MILYSIRHFWLGSRCIQEKSFTIQERWILSQHSDTIFRSPTCLASEIYTFVTCHYDVFCVFFHDIVLDSSFLTGFPLYTRKILHYTWKLNPFQHSDTIFRSSTSLASEIYTFVYCHYDVFLCVFSWYCARFVIFDWVPVVYKKNPSLYMKDESVPTFWHNFQIFNKPSFWDIHVCILSLRCILCVFSWYCTRFVIFWLGSRCIQEKSFTIQERWILSQHSDTIFRSPTCLASEIYTFVSCHYDVFCVFFHDIVLDSSFLTGFTLYTRKILHYTRKMNPFPTFWHNFQISNIPSFWDIHVCILSLRCILCVFSWYCTRFVIFDWVHVVYKKNPSLYKKDESFPNILTQFSDLQHS